MACRNRFRIRLVERSGKPPHFAVAVWLADGTEWNPIGAWDYARTWDLALRRGLLPADGELTPEEYEPRPEATNEPRT